METVSFDDMEEVVRGYYGPSFAGLNDGWYFRTNDPNYATERDECLRWWNRDCDKIVREHVLQYGMFVSALEASIKDAIRTHFQTYVRFPRYFMYFFMSRVLDDNDLAKVYLEDCAARLRKPIRCTVCGKSQMYCDIHPSLMRRTRRVLPLCNECWFWMGELTQLESLTEVTEDFKERVRRLSQEQVCPICHTKFVWVTKDVRYTFEVPFLPARHIEICPRCAEKAILGLHGASVDADSLARLKQVAELTGRIPDKTGFVYDAAPTLETAIAITKIMQKMPSFPTIAKAHGSWFKALIAAGILPDGTRRTRYGTRVLARDGHECLSLAEKTIDDMMSDNGIVHEKEVPYPGANYRADWKIIVGGKEIFVELFGLDGLPGYTKRKQEKIAFAQRAGIDLVAFVRRDLQDLRAAFGRKILGLIRARE